jgi:enoyl-[acyl-carrier protein] reductase II
MKESEVCRLLDIRYPILQGGMHWLADARLAAAVSNAGALGTLSPYGGMGTEGDVVDHFRAQIRRLRQWTANPFAVNILLDLPVSGLLADAAVRERAPVVVTASGSPQIYTQLFHASGMRVFHVISTVEQAKYAASCGADAVIAAGFESAGRIGPEAIPLFELLPRVVKSVNVPVVAAGGIADGKDMAAACALGADAVQMGTRFVAVEQCPAHPAYKQAIIASGAGSTLVTRRSGVPIRSLRTHFIEKLAAMEQSGASAESTASFAGSGRARAAQLDGDMDNGDAYAGTSVEKVNEILPVGDVIRYMMRDYVETTEGRKSKVEG